MVFSYEIDMSIVIIIYDKIINISFMNNILNRGK